MMNVISNCCLGGYIYKDVIEQKFSNPFIWAWLNKSDMMFLVNNYETINFQNYDISKYNDEPLKDGMCFQLRIDNKINIVYSHYQFNSSCDFYIDRNKNMVYSNNIWKYIVNKYDDRVCRMLSDKTPPCFAICDNRNNSGNYTEEDVKILSKSKYKIIFCSANDYSKYANKNFLFIHHNGNDIITIKEKYKNEITNFLLS